MIPEDVNQSLATTKIFILSSILLLEIPSAFSSLSHLSFYSTYNWIPQIRKAKINWSLVKSKSARYIRIKLISRHTKYVSLIKASLYQKHNKYVESIDTTYNLLVANFELSI